jgi:hypothetical protein
MAGGKAEAGGRVGGSMRGAGMAVARTPGVRARFLPTEVLGMLWARWRLKRERHTIAAMIAIYCRDYHHARGLCDDCAVLGAYADERLDKCVYAVEKPTCLNCPIHCYKRDQREAIREVMRYAGPRMLMRHPILAAWHVLDGRRPAPERPATTRARWTRQ